MEKNSHRYGFMHEGEGEENNDGRHIDYFERMMGSDFSEFWKVFR